MAVARPWIFAEWTDGLTPEPDIFFKAAIDLARLLAEYYDETRALRRYKRFAFYFCANFRYGHSLYKEILNAREMSEVKDVFYNFLKVPPEIGSRPNLNFFT